MVESMITNKSAEGWILRFIYYKFVNNSFQIGQKPIKNNFLGKVLFLGVIFLMIWTSFVQTFCSLGRWPNQLGRIIKSMNKGYLIIFDEQMSSFRPIWKLCLKLHTFNSKTFFDISLYHLLVRMSSHYSI